MQNGKLYGFGQNGKYLVQDEKGKIVKVYSCVKSYEAYVKANDVIVVDKAPETQKPITIDVNKRFDFLSRLTKMVIDGITPSLFVTGEGGLGKTHTILEAIAEKRMSEGSDFTIVKGYSTAKGLYRTLYENRDKLVIFDDCDSVFKDRVSLNLLKGALDNYSKRVISWNAEFFEDDLPNSFEFIGSVIFISNLSMGDVDQAIKSRSLLVDLFMNQDEKINRLEFILPNVEPNISLEEKQVCINFLKKYKNIIKDLNVRTLIKVIKIKTTQPNDIWEEMALYMVQS